MTDKFIYNEDWASIYEKFSILRGKRDEAAETVAFLEPCASGGSALELGVGDGRVAAPLSERGVRVEGIDNSDSMLELLARRTDLVKAWKGDIANFRSERRYNLVYCVWNTFPLLVTRETQIACLRSAVEALDDGGIIVIDVGVPPLDGLVSGQKTSTLFVDHENTILNSAIHDPLTQTFVSTLLWFSGTEVRRLPHRVRYVYHQELDTMAECVGLELAERWGDWTRGAFTKESKRHISVYRRNRPLV
ncbi:MAG: methyltransferase domain-containing protein [Mesorhizobium sp.]|uniref:class I SAM-dependent DNA methyltransferase n=1 Tax=unclassified Mesorhizobium TaxID=325217 RepID=UPI000F7587C5|nr:MULTISPECIES: class I SAM-dependent methyltransferase [unclassified Mesorhizobium]RVC72850.1 methyltransferase domain-containing protein [Mesorhizobium sp. M2A.F.Ca.ET.046.02.1.1]AZO34169.1 class I SAM-dependent methyltransferase [Mesorhizobium sp. M2A.F.Ca.ET.046.03.2.1]AZO71598.1 class I SAM-dependent methyltransferase [Mesorhizobium sp. M1D.F.Ca.ET.043.01.1.1]RWB49824.1 MAG: methyltransferase domain-containing protein [Mesorhizobium sp.]RWD00875.1 MAG: methyltransferase domain-containing